MNTEICQKSEKFLAEIVEALQFDLIVSVKTSAEGYLLDLSGNDVSFLLNEGGEVLDAFEVILFQVFGRNIEKSERFVCDADGFRQTRKAELQAMARFAAQNVRKSNKPFNFGKLNSTERRIIHLTLADEVDLETESIGEGRDRHLQVRLK